MQGEHRFIPEAISDHGIDMLTALERLTLPLYFRDSSGGEYVNKTFSALPPQAQDAILNVFRDEHGKSWSRQLVTCCSASYQVEQVQGLAGVLGVASDVSGLITFQGLYRALSAVNRLLTRRLAPQTLFEETCDALIRFAPVDLVWVATIDWATGEVTTKTVRARDPVLLEYAAGLKMRLDDPEAGGPIRRAITEGVLQVVQDTSKDATLRSYRERQRRYGLASTAAYPVYRHGRVVAVLVTYMRKKHFFTEEIVGLLAEVAEGLGFGLDDYDRARELERLARYDPLTGLANRMHFLEQLDRAVARASQDDELLALLYLDLDGFKQINDSFGHGVGDELLRNVAQRLECATHEGEFAGRLGGDEFVVVFRRLPHPDQVSRRVDRLIDELKREVVVEGRHLAVSVSIGISVYPGDGADSERLLRHADMAMYQAKAAGPGQYRFFDSLKGGWVKAQPQPVERIRQGIAQGRLALEFQPIIRLQSGQVKAMEALVRWVDNSGVTRPPSFFMPDLEGTPAMVDMDRWVMRAAFNQAAAWRRSQSGPAVSVNCSKEFLLYPDFLKELDRCLADSRLPPEEVTLEIPETVSHGHLAKVLPVIRQVRRRAVRVALDDFGTAASSLVHLQELPADELKVDQRFVRTLWDNPRNFAILESVAHYCRLSEQRAVAEGIEDPLLGLAILRVGISFGQGYAIARPMAGRQVPDWTEKWKPHPAWQRRDHWIDRPGLSELLAATYAHSTRIEQLIASVGDPGAFPLDQVEDLHVCRFGRWYDTIGQKTFGNFIAFKELGDVHARAHRLGQELLAIPEPARARAGQQIARDLAEVRTALGRAVLRLLEE